MAPKRKAAAPGAGRSAKRIASGMNTPVSMGSSDDEYSDSGDVEEVDRVVSRQYTSQCSFGGHCPWPILTL